MELGLNPELPRVMHVDLNSCFATVEQQASPRLRGKPLVVAAYDKLFACVLAPSIEAKKFGIKVGMSVNDAKLLCPSVIVRTPDPPKYRAVHAAFRKIFESYSPDVVPKSIDEAVIDFTPVSNLYPTTQDLIYVAEEIKRRMRREIGEWITCSIGIGANRFWAKTGAGLHKPDGLDVLTNDNIRGVLKTLKLIDLCGINVRYQLRLNKNGIYTPLQFIDAPLLKLQKQVFESINGYYWYMRLRGWEIDRVEFERKSYGQQYALTSFMNSRSDLAAILMKLTEKMGRRLRRAGKTARGVWVGASYRNLNYWHRSVTFEQELFTTQELFEKVWSIFSEAPREIVTRIAVSCFNLSPAGAVQRDLFESNQDKKRAVSKARDFINDTYGEFVVVPARMMNMDKVVIDRVAFGNAGLGD